MVWWIVESIPLGGPIELFLVPTSATHLMSERPCYILPLLWNGAYKRYLAANWKE